MPDYRPSNIPSSAHLLQAGTLVPDIEAQFPPEDSDISNFFVLITDTEVTEDIKHSKIRWFKAFFGTHILVTDAKIEQLPQTEANTLDLRPYHINRLFLHAFFVRIENWSECFTHALGSVIEWINKWDPNDAIKRQLKESSYSPSLLRQLELLLELKQLLASDATPEVKQRRCKYAIEFTYHAANLYIEIPARHYRSLFHAIKSTDNLKEVLADTIAIQGQTKNYLGLICAWRYSREFPRDLSEELINRVFELPTESWACNQAQLVGNKVGVFHLLKSNSFFSSATHVQMMTFLEKIPPAALSVSDNQNRNGLYMLLSITNGDGDRNRIFRLMLHYPEKLLKLLLQIPPETWSLSLSTGMDQGVNALWLLVSNWPHPAFFKLTADRPDDVITLLQKIPACAWEAAPNQDLNETKNALYLFFLIHREAFQTLANYDARAMMALLNSFHTNAWTMTPAAGLDQGINALWLLFSKITRSAFSKLVADHPGDAITFLQKTPACAWEAALNQGPDKTINVLYLFLHNHKETFQKLANYDARAMMALLNSFHTNAWTMRVAAGLDQGVNALWLLFSKGTQSAFSKLIVDHPDQACVLLRHIPKSAFRTLQTSSIETLISRCCDLKQDDFTALLELLLTKMPPQSLRHFFMPNTDDNIISKKIWQTSPAQLIKLLNLNLEFMLADLNPSVLLRDCFLFQLIVAHKNRACYFSREVRLLSDYLFNSDNRKNPDIRALIDYILQTNWQRFFPEWGKAPYAALNVLAKEFLSLLDLQTYNLDKILGNDNIPEEIKLRLRQAKPSHEKAKRLPDASRAEPAAKKPSIFTPALPAPDKGSPPEDEVPAAKRPR